MFISYLIHVATNQYIRMSANIHVLSPA